MSEFERITILEQELKKVKKDLKVLLGIVTKLSSSSSLASVSNSNTNTITNTNKKFKKRSKERTIQWVSTLKPLAVIDKKKYASILDIYNRTMAGTLKRKRNTKEDNDKNTKKEKNNDTNNASITDASSSLIPSLIPPSISSSISSAALVEKLKSITVYDNKIDMIKQLSEEQLKRLCNSKTGAGIDLLCDWLVEEAVYMENNADNFRGIALVKLLVTIFDPTVEKTMVKWNSDKVKSTRIDKHIRRIYQCLQTKIGTASMGVNPEMDILIGMSEVLKKTWTKFREIFHASK